MTSKKVKFTPEEEEQISDWVKSHEILYNVRHTKFRDAEAKNRLWLQLSNELAKDVEAVKKKWTTMRDYYVRSKEKTTGSAATTSKRDESFSFLDQTSVLKRPTMSSLPSTSGAQSPVPLTPLTPTELDAQADRDSVAFETLSNADTHSYFKSAYSEIGDSAFSPTPSAKKRKASEMIDTNAMLREFLVNRPKPSDFIQPKPVDDIQHFCDSIGSTMPLCANSHHLQLPVSK